MPESQIRILSLNCWGLKYVAKHRAQRINAIASELSNFDHDIVGLQEIWVFADYELVRSRVAKRLPYSKFFYSGALGAGLALFSRFPIIGATVHPYSLNGSPIDVIAGDWFVGKAAASIVIMHPALGEVEVFNTHLFAKGGEDGPEHNRAHRLVNAWEFAKLARISAERGRYVIATGDFNSIPTTLPMTIIRDHAALTDAWGNSHAAAASTSAMRTTPVAAIDLFGVTADSPLNSYSAGKPLDRTAITHQGKRLDYIFYRQPSSLNYSRPYLACTSSNIVLTDKVPGCAFSFSDHFGVEATLEIRTSPGLDHENGTNTHHDTLPPTRLSDESIASVLQALVACYRISRSKSRLQLATFSVCVTILIVLVVGSAWLPRPWINPIFILFTVFVSWLATTMLYVGFLYGNWEVRALTNVIEELELTRNHLHRSRLSSVDGG